jgi:hypothetical protein
VSPICSFQWYIFAARVPSSTVESLIHAGVGLYARQNVIASLEARAD